jgi:HEAT repeat protein
VRSLAADPDPLVRAAAYTAFANLGATADDAAELAAALQDSAWQVRQGAARGLAGSPAATAVESLTSALTDPHHDVRKAAVLSLGTWAAEPAIRETLRGALDDVDADVRAYARQAITTPPP